MIVSKRAAVIIAAVVIAVALCIVPVAADSGETKGTPVALYLTELTIHVDETIAGWGYYVDADSPSVKHTDLVYKVVVGREKTVQILVNGTEPLPTGWYLSVEDASGCSYDIPGNLNRVDVSGFSGSSASISLEANNTNTVTVTFDSNGGSAVETQVITQGSAAAEPAAPARSGYTFSGWFTDNGTFQNKWDFADAVNADMTLYAKWLAVPCTVTFEPENGSASWMEVYEYGEKIVQPEDLEKTGYVLEGWYYGSAKWDFENDVVTSDMTLTAHWTPVTYFVKFNANGGTGFMDDQQFVYDVSQNLTANAYKRSSYSFQGWAESATGSVVYRNHAEVKNLSTVQEDVVDLYAVWRYNGGGGGSGSSSKVVPKIVDEITIEVDFQKIITIPAVDEDGNYVVLPIEQLIMTDPVTGVVYVGDKTEEYDSLVIVPSLKETIKYITEYRVETIAEALAAGIPVYENYIGGNGHAPLLVEDLSVTVDPVKFYQVIEISTDVTGGNLREIVFKVPLAALEERGFTTTDVVLYHGVKEDSERVWYPLVTTLEWCDKTYAYYAAKTDGASPFGILFLKDSTCMVPVSPVSPDEPVTPVETPVPVLGVIAGLLSAGAAAMLGIRRK